MRFHYNSVFCVAQRESDMALFLFTKAILEKEEIKINSKDKINIKLNDGKVSLKVVERNEH